ncbi:MAG: response regulator transcription factor, partial [Anaerovoracaceae bacterium]
LRTKTSCPILFLSSRSSDTDQVYAMVNGGDDYITKPFSFEVVTAKVNAHIRRVYGEYAVAADQELGCGDCTFYKGKLMLQCNEEKAMLSKTEAGIIKLLFEAYPNVVSRENLLNEIWDDESFVEENTLNVTISRLRKRLAGIHSELRINPVRGVGYRIGVKTDEV